MGRPFARGLHPFAVRGARAEEALGRAEGLLHEAVTSGPVVLFSIDTAGTVTMAEGGAYDNRGGRPADTVGRSAWDMYRDTEEGLAALRVLGHAALVELAPAEEDA